MSKQKKKETPEKQKRPEDEVWYDLACGNNLQDQFIGVDISTEGTQATIAFDLESFPWEFAKDQSVDRVFCSHYIEHVSDLCMFMNEVWRILKPGGFVQFIAPYWSSVRAWQDPTHKRVISEMTFLYFDKEWRKANKLEHYPIITDFKVEKIDHAISEEFNGRAQEAIQYAAVHYLNVVNDILVTLRKPK